MFGDGMASHVCNIQPTWGIAEFGPVLSDAEPTA
jgi:hypothetical protein